MKDSPFNAASKGTTIEVTSRETEIGRELNFLRDKCSGLESVTQLLKERLQMVTRQCPPQPCDVSAEKLPPIDTDLGNTLRARSSEITNCTMQLRELLELLAL